MRQAYLFILFLIVGGNQNAWSFNQPISPLFEFKKISECYELSPDEFGDFTNIERDKEQVEDRFDELERSYLECVRNDVYLVSPIKLSDHIPAVASGEDLNQYLVHKKLAEIAYKAGLQSRSKKNVVNAFMTIELLFPTRLDTEMPVIGNWGIFPETIVGFGVDHRLPANFKELLVLDFMDFAEAQDLPNLAEAMRNECLPVAIAEKESFTSNSAPYYLTQHVKVGWIAERYP